MWSGGAGGVAADFHGLQGYEGVSGGRPFRKDAKSVIPDSSARAFHGAGRFTPPSARRFPYYRVACLPFLILLSRLSAADLFKKG